MRQGFFLVGLKFASVQSKNIIRDYQQAGTLKEWQTYISAYCIGNSRLALAVSCAIAAMLLHPAGIESGGIHFVSESSSGKTTGLRIAASFMDRPIISIVGALLPMD